MHACIAIHAVDVHDPIMLSYSLRLIRLSELCIMQDNTVQDNMTAPLQ